MSKKTSKFADILKSHISSTDTEEIVKTLPSPLSPKKGGIAKSKNPDYTQVSAYLPSSLYKKTKMNLLSNDMEFSELVEILLNKWNEDKIAT